MTSIRRRLGFPSPALIIAFAALSISLGAVAFAAVKAPKNSVVSSSVKNEALKGGDIKDNSLTGDDVDEGSLKINFPAVPDAPTSATPIGAAGGDLTGTYPNPTIADGSVVGAKVADGAVSTAKLLDGSVTTEKLADSAVTAGKLGTSAVTNTKIATDAVTSSKIATDAVTNSELGANSITSGNITNGQVTGDDVNLDRVVVTASTADNSTAFKGTQANCTGGRTAVGGGAFIIESDPNQQPLIALIDSNVTDVDSYAANANEIGAGTALDWHLEVSVICLDI